MMSATPKSEGPGCFLALASAPRGDAFREVSVQYLALLEAWTRAASAGDCRAKERACALSPLLQKLVAVFEHWCRVHAAEPDHFAPLFQTQIARIRRRLRAD
jgi:hypothetical protein